MAESPSISLPQGVRDILPEESKGIGEAESGILSVFEGYGFARIITPLLEYVDVLSLGMGEKTKKNVLKFIDPSTGKVMAIRPDITPQIARVAAARMRDYPLPLKLCYNANVLRYAEQGESRSREVLQVGAEYISKEATPEADAEMITMAVEALDKLGLKDFKIDVGDVGFLKTVLERVDEPERALIREAVAKKDANGVEAVLGRLEGRISAGDRALLAELTSFYGEEGVIEKAASLSNDKATLASLDYIKRVIDMVYDQGYKDFVTIDLGEVRGFDYYTGIIFEGFATGIGKPILGGGRYDNLLGKYGYEAAATGFAFDVENVVAALTNQSA